MWELAAVAIFCLVGFLIGVNFATLKERIERLEFVHKTAAEQTKPKSAIYDPDDAIQMAKMEQEELMRRLNPKAYDDL